MFPIEPPRAVTLESSSGTIERVNVSAVGCTCSPAGAAVPVMSCQNACGSACTLYFSLVRKEATQAGDALRGRGRAMRLLLVRTLLNRPAPVCGFGSGAAPGTALPSRATCLPSMLITAAILPLD
eukprot:5983397-Prymnesium_polylepis.1